MNKIKCPHCGMEVYQIPYTNGGYQMVDVSESYYRLCLPGREGSEKFFILPAMTSQYGWLASRFDKHTRVGHRDHRNSCDGFDLLSLYGIE